MYALHGAHSSRWPSLLDLIFDPHTSCMAMLMIVPLPRLTIG
jgi:hypothetical protein